MPVEFPRPKRLLRTHTSCRDVLHESRVFEQVEMTAL